MKKGYTMIENRMLLDKNLSCSDLRVWLILKYHAMNKKKCWPGLKVIAGETGLSTRTVIRCTKHLEQIRYIQKSYSKYGQVIYTITGDKISPAGDNISPDGDKSDIANGIITNGEEPKEEEIQEGKASFKEKQSFTVSKSETVGDLFSDRIKKIVEKKQTCGLFSLTTEEVELYASTPSA